MMMIIIIIIKIIIIIVIIIIIMPIMIGLIQHSNSKSIIANIFDGNAFKRKAPSLFR